MPFFGYQGNQGNLNYHESKLSVNSDLFSLSDDLAYLKILENVNRRLPRLFSKAVALR